MADTINTSFAALKGAVDPTIKSITDAIFGVQSNEVGKQESYQKSQTQQDIITGAIRTVTATKELGEAATQKTMLDLSVAASDDGIGIASAQSRLISEYKNVEDARAGKLAQINAKKAIRPEDDLFGWITAQFTIDSDVADYNAAGDVSNQKFSQLQGLNTLIDSSWQAQQKVMQTKTAASAQAAADKAAAESEQVKQTFAREGYISNSAAMKDVAALTAQQMVVRNQAFNADAQMESIRNARAHLALAMNADARAEVQLGLAKDAAKRDEERLAEFVQDKEDKRAAIKTTGEMIRRGMVAAGATPQQIAPYLDDQYLRNMVAGRTPQDPKLQEYLRLGNKQMTAGLDPSARIIGISPSDALQTITLLNPKLSDDARKTYESVLVKARDDVLGDRTPAVQAVLASKDKVQFDRLVNDRANVIVKENAAHIGDPNSIYYLPPVKTIAELLPNIKTMKMWSAFLGDAVATGIDTKNPQTVLALGQLAISENKISVNQLADEMAAMYGSAQALNLISKQVNNLGLEAPPSYRGLDGNGKPVDYTKSLEIKKAIMTPARVGTTGAGVFGFN